jgi:uncharacterized protein
MATTYRLADAVAAAPTPAAPAAAPPPALPQLRLRQIVGVWAAAALPMGLLAWVGAPLFADRLSGPATLAQALLITLTGGLIWQFVLVMLLVRREQGTLRWPVVRDALWLRAPLAYP